MAQNVRHEFKELSTHQIKEWSDAQTLPFSILAFNIHGGLNIGTMMRSAHLCGCKEFVIFGRRKFDTRSTVGVENYMTVKRIAGVKSGKQDFVQRLDAADYDFDDSVFVDFINSNKYTPIFFEQSEESRPFSQLTKEIMETIENPILIFGNESTGIPKNILETRHKFPKYFVFEIKQRGVIQSFNVSSICSIVCYKFMEDLTSFY